MSNSPHIDRVVVSGTIYNLFFNLLITPEAELNSTCYFICGGIPEIISKHLENVFLVKETFKFSRIKQIYYFLKFRLFRKVFYPNLSYAQIYAQDHLPISPFVIGRRPYSFTEDAPDIFNVICKQKYVKDLWTSKNKYKGLLKSLRLFFNPIAGGVYANNELCNKLIISVPSVPEYVKGKEIQIVELKKCWEKSSTEKQRFILDTFNITEDDLQVMKTRKIIIFTQPFWSDNLLTYKEHLDVYKKLIYESSYKIDDIVIKTHPRDSFDYKRVFPNIYVFDKPVPMQFLDVIGLKFEEAATICSTAVLNLPYKMKINWIGARVHPILLKEYGNYTPCFA